MELAAGSQGQQRGLRRGSIARNQSAKPGGSGATLTHPRRNPLSMASGGPERCRPRYPGAGASQRRRCQAVLQAPAARAEIQAEAPDHRRAAQAGRLDGQRSANSLGARRERDSAERRVLVHGDRLGWCNPAGWCLGGVEMRRRRVKFFASDLPYRPVSFVAKSALPGAPCWPGRNRDNDETYRMVGQLVRRTRGTAGECLVVLRGAMPNRLSRLQD